MNNEQTTIKDQFLINCFKIYITIIFFSIFSFITITFINIKIFTVLCLNHLPWYILEVMYLFLIKYDSFSPHHECWTPDTKSCQNHQSSIKTIINQCTKVLMALFSLVNVDTTYKLNTILNLLPSFCSIRYSKASPSGKRNLQSSNILTCLLI